MNTTATRVQVEEEEREPLRKCLREMAGDSAAVLIRNQEDFAPRRWVNAIIEYGRAIADLSAISTDQRQRILKEIGAEGCLCDTNDPCEGKCLGARIVKILTGKGPRNE